MIIPCKLRLSRLDLDDSQRANWCKTAKKLAELMKSDEAILLPSCTGSFVMKCRKYGGREGSKYITNDECRKRNS